MIGVALVGFITIFAASAKASISHAIDSSSRPTTSSRRAAAGSAYRPQPGARRDRSRALPRDPGGDAGAARPRRQIDGSGDFLVAADPQATVDSCSTSTCSRGDVRRPRRQRHRGLEAQGRRQPLEDRRHGPGARSSKTGEVPLKVQLHLRGAHTFAGDYFISLADVREELHRPARLPDLRQAEAGRDAPSRAARRSSRSLKPYPTAKLKDNAQYKADQKKQVNQVARTWSTCCCSSR